MIAKSNKIILLFVTVVFLGVLSACMTTMHSQPGTTTTVIMIRHADRNLTGSKLTERGIKNAQALVKELGHMNIAAIYSPDLVRNLETVRPLAKHLGINISKVGDEPDEQQVVLTIIEKHAGQTVLWVGNSYNLPEIYRLLGGKGGPPLKYGDLFILTVPDQGDTIVVKSKWGDNE